MKIIIVIITIMIFSFNVLFSVCVERSYKFKRDSVKEARWLQLQQKVPRKQKPKGLHLIRIPCFESGPLNTATPSTGPYF